MNGRIRRSAGSFSGDPRSRARVRTDCQVCFLRVVFAIFFSHTSTPSPLYDDSQFDSIPVTSARRRAAARPARRRRTTPPMCLGRACRRAAAATENDTSPHTRREKNKRARLEPLCGVESNRRARGVPWLSYARTPVPTLPNGSPSPSSAHRFFAGFKLEGDSGGDLFLGTTTAPARCTGVEGPSVFVRRYRVPQALHSIGLDAGPRRHCGESARWVRGSGGTRGGYRQRTFWMRRRNASTRGSARSRRRAGHRVRSRARVPARLSRGNATAARGAARKKR